MAAPRDPASDRQRDLLRVICCVAWADGRLSQEESDLLQRIVRQYLSPEDADGQASLQAETDPFRRGALDLAELDAVIPRLISDEDRRLAVKLAYLMARIDHEEGAASPISAEEKLAYRRLVEGVGLSADQVQAAEWAAERELDERRGVWVVLSSVFGDLGGWPSPELLASPAMRWL